MERFVGMIDEADANGPYVFYAEAQEEIAQRDATIAALQAVIDDHNRLVREMDVRLNGEQGAAKQASLCDIVSQVQQIQAQLTQRTAELEAANKLLYKKNCELGRFETMISDLQAGVDRLVHMAEMKQAALTATSQPVKPAGKMHACDIPGCVSCGNPEDATSQEGQHG